MNGQNLRFLVYGAGAIGTYIGGSLTLSGYKCVFIERQEFAVELARHGLHLHVDEKHLDIPNPIVVSSIEAALEQGYFDACIFAIKSFDTQTTAQELKPLSSNLPPFICLQNGVENESILAAMLGSEKVIPATLTSAISRLKIGEIILERKRGIGIASDHSLSDSLFTAFKKSGLNPKLYSDPCSMKWSKLLTNLICNASSAILNMSPAEIFADKALFRLEMSQLNEALQVMKAQDIRPTDLPATPVRLLTFAVKNLPFSISQPILRRSIGVGRGSKMPSFHIDLYSGRGKSEVYFLNGAVVRFGERLGIPTPVNKLLTETLDKLTLGELEIGSFSKNPRKLLNLLGE